jgi:hypothetical protein
MKCKKSTTDCKLELKFLDNGDVNEFCTICDYQHLHRRKDIKSNYLNPYKKED